MAQNLNAACFVGFSLLALLGAPAVAQVPVNEDVTFRGTVESELGVTLRDGSAQKWDTTFVPEIEADLGGGWQLTGIGRIRVDPVDNLEPDQPANQQAVRGPLSRRFFVGDALDAELRELYLDGVVQDAFIRVGKQQIVWGQADGLRVLDIVNPFNFREFILPDFEDRRIPLWSVNAEIPVGDWFAQLIWIPDHTYSQLPDANGTFAVSSPRFVPSAPEAPPRRLILQDPDRPNDLILDDGYGARLSTFKGGWDLSLNYLYDFADDPVLFQHRRPDGTIVVDPTYERTHVFGGSASKAFKSLTLRSEFAVSTDRFFLTRDLNDRDGVIKSTDVSYVAGIDYNYNADLLISAQFFQSILTNHPTATIRDRVESQATLLIRREFWNDTLSAEGLVIQSLNDGDGVLQLDLSYAYRANVHVSLGADIFYGSDAGVFGQFDSANRVTFGVEVGF